MSIWREAYKVNDYSPITQEEAEKYGFTWRYNRWMEEIYQGCVVSDWEHNMPDDSEFYALVWDEPTQRLTTYMWKYTGLGGSDYNSCHPDITPENLAKAIAWAEPTIRKLIGDYNPTVHIWKPGRRVRVKSGRKVPIGTEGSVLWEGECRWGRRCKFATADGQELWTDTHNLEFTDTEDYLYTEEEKEARYQANRKNFYAIFRSCSGVDLRSRSW